MTSKPYERFESHELILTDELAMDRTALANERTLLAYIRTGLAFAVTGAGTIKFFASVISLLLGWCMVVLAFVVAALGVWRFRRVAGHLSAHRTLPPVERRPAPSASPAVSTRPERGE